MDVFTYARWSSLEQTKGSTLQRQMANCASYVEGRGWTVAEAIVDRGRSAYTGANLTTGQLGEFAERVRTGALRNPTLVVEELDRLSRQPADMMLSWLSPLVRKGLSIHVTQTGQIIDRNMLDHDMGGLMMILITAFGSHKESAKKAERVAAAWDKKRTDAAAGGNVTRTHRHPQWIEVADDGQFIAVPARKAIVERIFADRLAGMGKMLIAKRLNADKIDTWAHTARKQENWSATYVGRILVNRAVLGEWQPHSQPRGGERKPVGEPVANYYPAIIDPATFAKANDQRAEQQRKHQGRGRSISNLLGTRARCGVCGGQMSALGSAAYRTNKDGSKTRHYFLYCTNAKVAKSCDNERGWTYDRVEGPLLDKILSLAMDDQHFSRKDEAAPIEAEVFRARDEVEALRSRIKRLIATADKVEADDDDEDQLAATISLRRAELKAAKARQADAEERLAEARGKTSPSEHLRRVGEVRAMMSSDDAEERFQARSRVKEALHNVVETMKFFPRSGEVAVLLVDRMRRFEINHDGTLGADFNFLEMHPEAFGPKGLGVLVSRYQGVETRENDLDEEQHAARVGYIRRVSADG